MKKLVIAIVIVTVLIVTIAFYLVETSIPKKPKPVDYTIYVYDNGVAQIEVDNINKVIQTHEDYMIDGMELKAGTVILPGNGNKIYYEYARRDTIYELKTKEE